jgi:hypothetical protein
MSALPSVRLHEPARAFHEASPRSAVPPERGDRRRALAKGLRNEGSRKRRASFASICRWSDRRANQEE